MEVWKALFNGSVSISMGSSRTESLWTRRVEQGDEQRLVCHEEVLEYSQNVALARNQTKECDGRVGQGFRTRV